MDDRTKHLQRQLGVDVAAALDRAEIHGEQRVYMLLEMAYALASLEQWSMQQLAERALNKWKEQLKRDTARQLITVVH